MMVNQINDSSNIKPMDPEKRLNTKEKQQTERVIDSASKIDKVDISTESKHLDALKASLVNIPEVNEARVQYFKNEIASGKYKINSDKIAFNMLNNLELA